MENKIEGLHHITAIAGSAKRNLDFYTKVLGLKLIKKTVNFDDPGTYHLYYGNEIGTPGTILTFFPWEGIQTGRRGTGLVTEIGYSVPEGSFDYWLKRFEKFNVIHNKPAQKFGEHYLTFLDPDGLKFELVIPKTPDTRIGFNDMEIDVNAAILGFRSATLTVSEMEGTAKVLTDILGYRLDQQEVNRFRFKTDVIDNANIIDIVEAKGEKKAYNGGGTVHHIAFRVKDEITLMHYRERVMQAGFSITPKIDRNYFFSLYFREPGGILFEIATDNPGFSVDEPIAELGTTLKLPAQYESRRNEIEKILPILN